MHGQGWQLALGVVLPILLLLTTAGQTSAQGGGIVSIASDRDTYQAGEPIEVTISNLGTVPVVPRGGLVCDDLWPVRTERQGGLGWEPVPIPPTRACVGIAAALLAPGETLTKIVIAAPEPGTYRLLYHYTVVGSSTGPDDQVAYSDAYVVQ